MGSWPHGPMAWRHAAHGRMSWGNGMGPGAFTGTWAIYEGLSGPCLEEGSREVVHLLFACVLMERWQYQPISMSSELAAGLAWPGRPGWLGRPGLAGTGRPRLVPPT